MVLESTYGKTVYLRTQTCRPQAAAHPLVGELCCGSLVFVHSIQGLFSVPSIASSPPHSDIVSSYVSLLHSVLMAFAL